MGKDIKGKELGVGISQRSEYVFQCRKGTPVKNSTYDTMLFKLCDKIGIPRFSMHVLRHTFATKALKAENPIKYKKNKRRLR